MPSLFIGGEKDGPTIWGASSIARFSETLPALHGSHILAGAGHWVQQERPGQVNELLLDWLRSPAVHEALSRGQADNTSSRP